MPLSDIYQIILGALFSLAAAFGWVLLTANTEYDERNHRNRD